MQGTILGPSTRGRLKTTWMDNILQWTGQWIHPGQDTHDWGQSQVETARSWCGQASEPRWLNARQGKVRKNWAWFKK